MSIALYRKYRPKNFFEVTNQNHIKVTLQNEIEHDQLAHAYLFCGPRGTGKTTLARLLSKAVNCLDLQDKGEPCNKCASCQEIMANKSMDIIEIDAASHTGVDNVRENIINNARFTPNSAKYKVFIIDEVHMLSISAFNALLKILEEPPKHVIFILATTEAHKVPVTIISRCQRFDFKKIILSDLVERLQWIVKQENIQVDEQVLKIIAKSAGGCVRDAESLLEQVLSLGEKNITLDQAQLVLPKVDYQINVNLFEALVKKQTGVAIGIINELVEQGVDVLQFYKNFLEFLRKVLIFKINNNPDEIITQVEEELVKKINDLVAQVTVTDISEMLKVFLEQKDAMRYSYILQLPLELAVIKITEPKEMKICPPSAPTAAPENPKPTPTPPSPSPAPAETTQPKATEKIEPSTEPVEEIPQSQEPESQNKEFEEPKAESESEPKQEEAQPVVNNENVTLTFNQVISRWPFILSQIKKDHYSLGMSLGVAKPVALNGQSLQIGFMFDLQRSKVDTPQNLTIIKEIISQEFGSNLSIEVVLDSKLQLSDITNGNDDAEIKVEQTETKDPVGKVLDAFGGSVVDKI